MMNQSRQSLSVAVITGAHPYDVPSFQRMFGDFPDIECFIQGLDDFVHDWGEIRTDYDVVLFYNMHLTTPDVTTGGYDAALALAIEQLVETKQGVVVLHHALLAFPQWPLWSELCGLSGRDSFTYHHDELIRLRIVDHHHPITQGLDGWEMIDETYNLGSADENCEILVATDHPRSMESIAWTKTYGNSRVFCCALGHDKQSWNNASFRQLLRQGILWSGRGM